MSDKQTGRPRRVNNSVLRLNGRTCHILTKYNSKKSVIDLVDLFISLGLVRVCSNYNMICVHSLLHTGCMPFGICAHTQRHANV